LQNAIGHDHVESGNAVGRDKEQPVAEVEDFADLAALELLDAGQIELKQSSIVRVCHGAKYAAQGSRFKVQSSGFAVIRHHPSFNAASRLAVAGESGNH
jgi:hypothetical protein